MTAAGLAAAAVTAAAATVGTPTVGAMQSLSGDFSEPEGALHEALEGTDAVFLVMTTTLQYSWATHGSAALPSAHRL